MTAHEIYTSLFWLIAGGYLLFLGWFVWSWIRRDGTKRSRERHPSTGS